MLSVAVCDDSSYMRSITKKQLMNYAFQKNVEIQVYEYESGESLLESEISNKRVHDLIIIDFEFEEKGQNGIDIIRTLRKLKKKTKVIFLSSYPQVVFQSFEVDVYRFLVKPLDEKVLFKAMDDFIDSLATETILSVRIKGENCYYPEEIITFVEGYGKNCILHFSDEHQDVVCSETLSAIEERLSGDRFFRCHKSYLVNLGHVDSYNHAEITLDCEESIPLSRNKYKEFGAVLTEFITHKRGL